MLFQTKHELSPSQWAEIRRCAEALLTYDGDAKSAASQACAMGLASAMAYGGLIPIRPQF